MINPPQPAQSLRVPSEGIHYIMFGRSSSGCIHIKQSCDCTSGEQSQCQALKRPAQPEEIAPAFVYLASEVDSNYFMGEVLTLPGGETTAGQILLVCREMRARSESNL